MEYINIKYISVYVCICIHTYRYFQLRLEWHKLTKRFSLQLCFSRTIDLITSREGVKEYFYAKSFKVIYYILKIRN